MSRRLQNMRAQAVLLIVIGLLLGPAYYAFCQYFSGQTAETHTLTERANRWELPDGAILRLKSGLAYKPVLLELSPEQNRYRLRFTFDVTRGNPIPSGVRNSYQVSLMEGDVTVLERSIEIGESGAVSKMLDPIEISYPGNYVLLLEEIGTPPLGVSGVTLELLNRVESPRMVVVWCGIVMLGFGLVLILRDLLQKSLQG